MSYKLLDTFHKFPEVPCVGFIAGAWLYDEVKDVLVHLSSNTNLHIPAALVPCNPAALTTWKLVAVTA